MLLYFICRKLVLFGFGFVFQTTTCELSNLKVFFKNIMFINKNKSSYLTGTTMYRYINSKTSAIRPTALSRINLHVCLMYIVF